MLQASCLGPAEGQQERKMSLEGAGDGQRQRESGPKVVWVKEQRWGSATASSLRVSGRPTSASSPPFSAGETPAGRTPPEPSLLPHWPPRPPGAPPYSRFRQKLAKATESESWGEGGEQRRKELVMGGVRGSRNSVEKVGALGKKTP